MADTHSGTVVGIFTLVLQGTVSIMMCETVKVAPDTKDMSRISYVAQSCDGSEWSADA